MLKTFIKIAAGLLGAATFWKVGSYVIDRIYDDSDLGNSLDDCESGSVTSPIEDTGNCGNEVVNCDVSNSSSVSENSVVPSTVVEKTSTVLENLNKVQSVCQKTCSVVQVIVSTVSSLSQIFNQKNLGYTQNYADNLWSYSNNVQPPSVSYIPEAGCAIYRNPNSPIIKVIPLDR